MTGLQELSDNLVKISLLVVVRDLQGLSDADSTYRKNRKRPVSEAGEKKWKNFSLMLAYGSRSVVFGTKNVPFLNVVGRFL